MVLLEKIWDDVLAGPQPDRGLGKLLGKASPKPIVINQDGEGESSAGKVYQRSMPSPDTPNDAGNAAGDGEEGQRVRSLFHPGSNIHTKTIGADFFDKPQPNSPTVYDWMYSGETKRKHR